VTEIPLYRRDFRTLADLRVREAGVLAANGNQQGAYYLSGYAVECALKACIAKKTMRYAFPPKRKYIEQVYSHNLTRLLEAAGLDKELDRDMKTNTALAANWNTVRDWDEESRYVASGLRGSDLYAAITGANGVLPWIRQRW
jgi:HEPN domain-containing protein